MPARLPIHRAGVLAGRAADAVQRLPPLRIRQYRGPRIIHQDDVKRLRPIVASRVHPIPDGVIRIHPLTGRRPWQHLQQHLQVLQPRHDLVDPSQRDQRLRQRQAHPAVALALDDAHPTGLGDQEVRTTHSRLHLQKLLPQEEPRRIRKVLRSRAQVRQIHLTLEDLPNLLPVLMQRGNHDMRWLIVAQLNDQLRQVGLIGPNPRRLQGLIKLNLLGSHRLDLDDPRPTHSPSPARR